MYLFFKRLVPGLEFLNPQFCAEVDATGRQKGWASTLEPSGRRRSMNMSDHKTYGCYVSKEGFTTSTVLSNHIHGGYSVFEIIKHPNLKIIL